MKWRQKNIYAENEFMYFVGFSLSTMPSSRLLIDPSIDESKDIEECYFLFIKKFDIIYKYYVKSWYIIVNTLPTLTLSLGLK